MSEKPYLLSLIDAYDKAGAIESMKILRDTLASYELTPAERDEIDALLAKLLGVPQPASYESPTEEVSHSDHEAKLAEILVTLKTNPDGLADALEEGISPEFKARFADLIRARLERKGLIESIDWERNVSDYLGKCEEQGGIPMYRTRYLGRFEDREHPGKYLVLFICYGKKWSVWFNAVPIADIERLEAK
jgi:hypothetical protein